MQTEHNVDQSSHDCKGRLALQCLKLYNKAMDHLDISHIHPCERPSRMLTGQRVTGISWSLTVPTLGCKRQALERVYHSDTCHLIV